MIDNGTMILIATIAYNAIRFILGIGIIVAVSIFILGIIGYGVAIIIENIRWFFGKNNKKTIIR